MSIWSNIFEVILRWKPWNAVVIHCIRMSSSKWKFVEGNSLHVVNNRRTLAPLETLHVTRLLTNHTSHGPSWDQRELVEGISYLNRQLSPPPFTALSHLRPPPFRAFALPYHIHLANALNPLYILKGFRSCPKKNPFLFITNSTFLLPFHSRFYWRT